MPATTISGAEILARAESYIGRFHDGADVPMLAQEVATAFPDLRDYCALAGPETPWCGIFVAKVVTDFGIRPPHNNNDAGGFMYVDAWLSFGTAIPKGQEQPGDIAIFLGSPHHVCFYAGNGKYCGGNQSDAVTETKFREANAFRRVSATAGAVVPASGQSGRGSWYSQFQGRSSWVDSGDAPGSAALGVPDDKQGVAFYNRATLGKWFNVTAPNSVTLLLQQTDIGPSPRTGRLIDISSRAAEAFGYTPHDFPTNGVFTWAAAAPPAGLESLSAQQQAARYDIGPVEKPKTNDTLLTLGQWLDKFAPTDAPIAALIARVDALTAQMKDLAAEVKAMEQKMSDPTGLMPTTTKPQINPQQIVDVLSELSAVRAENAKILAQVANKQPPDLSGLLTLITHGSVWGYVLTAILGHLGAIGGAAVGIPPTVPVVTSLLTGTGLSAGLELLKRIFPKPTA